MEILKLRYYSLQQALLTLEAGFFEMKTRQNENAGFYTLMRDGIIQRFEYSIDSFWKFLKLYLELKKNVLVELSSPRAILRLALHEELISNAECQILLQALAERNLTSHTYNEELADKIYQNIFQYHGLMKLILIRLFV